MVTEHDDTSDELPTEVDPVRAALGPLFEVVIHATAADSPERERAMTEVLAAAERIRAALCPRQRLN
jgi:hypothetical protein